MAGLNISNKTKEFFNGALKEFKESFKLNDVDLDVDAKDGKLMVSLNNVGFSAKVPGAGAIAGALHAGNVGVVEPDKS